MVKAGQFQNALTAVPYPHQQTGYKDPHDPCNRSDKRNGGQYRRFERYTKGRMLHSIALRCRCMPFIRDSATCQIEGPA